jgi:hypothetical protein
MGQKLGNNIGYVFRIPIAGDVASFLGATPMLGCILLV